MVQNATARVRPRSMQFEKSSATPEPRPRRAASRDTGTNRPPPGARTSSLPLSSTKQYIYTPPIRHHRSMLDVERIPKLPLAKPLSYGELYVNTAEPVVDIMPPSRTPVDSQPPRAPTTGSRCIASLSI
jgi:septin 7